MWPAEQLAALRRTVVNGVGYYGVLPAGSAHGLLATLDAAARSLEAGRTATAVSQLEVFLRQFPDATSQFDLYFLDVDYAAHSLIGQLSAASH